VAKTIRIAIRPDGKVQAEVQGIKGRACTDYVKILEDLLDAEVLDSHYTPEYYADNVIQSRHDVDTQEQDRLGTGDQSQP